MRVWLVCDMDDGVLRREPTRRKALDWWKSLNEAPRVLGSHRYAEGSYSYTVGHSAEDHAGSVAIVRADVAHYDGWDADQQPLYPYDDDRRFEREERKEPDLYSAEDAEPERPRDLEA